MLGTQAADTHLCNNIIKLFIFFITAIPTSLRCTITLPFNPQIHIYGPGTKIILYIYLCVYVCVCAEKLPPFFNKQDEKHKVKTP